MDFLPIVEFEVNSVRSVSTGVAPFLAIKGYMSKFGLELPKPWDSNATQRAKREIVATNDFVAKIEDMRMHLRQELAWARGIQEEYVNRRRLPLSELRVEDLIMLDCRNIKTTRPNKSLDHKNMGPFKIIRAINNLAYELELFVIMKKVFSVFHSWLLHKITDDSLSKQRQSSSSSIYTNDEGADHLAEEILDFRIDNRRKNPVTEKKGYLMYKIKYIDYNDDNDPPIWQVFIDVVDCLDLITDFHHKNSDHEGSYSSFTTSQDWEFLLASLILYYAYRTERLNLLQTEKS